jgi:sugar phosphate isomerase/epimerase
MYKFICTDGLGVSTRQNELIELALTYNFKGIEVDMADMVGRARAMGNEFATQFVNSAAVEIATFRLPIDLRVSDELFAKELEKLDKVCELAKMINAKQCYLPISSSHPTLAYRENFEKHQQRLVQVAGKMDAVGVRIALMFQATKGSADSMQFIQKPEDLVALAKMVGKKNVGIVLDSWTWQLAGGTFDGIKQLDLNTVFEARLADPPVGVTIEKVDRTNRQEPGTHPDSIAQSMLDWLKEKDFKSPLALNAHVPKTPGNAGDLPFQRVGKALDMMIAGTHGVEPEARVEADDEEMVEVSSA